VSNLLSFPDGFRRKEILKISGVKSQKFESGVQTAVGVISLPDVVKIH
jgi:hypothetical protein